MTDRELIQMALDALESCLEDENHDGETFEYFDWRKVEAAKKALRDRIAQLERVDEKAKDSHEDWCASLTQLLLSNPPQPAPCDCKPLKRKWVGLTDEERHQISLDNRPYCANIMRAHEEELKRRNT